MFFIKISKLLIFVIIVCSCTTYNHKNPYPGMIVEKYEDNIAYSINPDNLDKLIINIEGSGWGSSLGFRDDRRWRATRNSAQFLQVLGNNYAFLITEKFNRTPFRDYSKDMPSREIYESQSLLNSYLTSINGFLEKYDFSSIILIGTSEGACLLPVIYENMNQKHLVKAMVSISFGAFSIYESYSVLSEKENVPPNYKSMYRFFVDTFSPDIDIHPNSYNENVFGVTYRWFNSFKDMRPYDYYKNIEIPILFIHGRSDTNVPVESTTYIQNNLKDKPFTYNYYDWAHQPSNYFDFINLRKDIANWIYSLKQ